MWSTFENLFAKALLNQLTKKSCSSCPFREVGGGVGRGWGKERAGVAREGGERSRQLVSGRMRARETERKRWR
jgi:hypothetical protein